jgi:hypothetical protein
MGKYGFNQRRLAEAVEVDTAQLCRMLDPDYPYRPLPATLEAMCEAMGCTADERLELYRLAGRVPREIVEAFCASAGAARDFRRLATKAQRR